jgi:hypothetical protein
MARATRFCRRSASWLRPALLVCLLAALAELPAAAQAACDVAIGPSEAQVLADQIWRNESGRDAEKILWWNPGEEFPSLGIGHFIWYPAGVDGPFIESFPRLLAFLSARGVVLPTWLEGDPPPGSPWSTREQFLDARHGPEATVLRRLLVETLALQAEFMLARLQGALDVMVDGLPPSRAATVEARFCALAMLPAGRYALVDYVNFKGEGVNPRERYAGQGWGLRQVLEEMRGQAPANRDFAAAAARVLERRVRNAPPERREQRWLAGWLRRIDTYR